MAVQASHHKGTTMKVNADGSMAVIDQVCRSDPFHGNTADPVRFNSNVLADFAAVHRKEFSVTPKAVLRAQAHAQTLSYFQHSPEHEVLKAHAFRSMWQSPGLKRRRRQRR